MRKKIQHFRFLLLFPIVFLPPIFLSAQENPQPIAEAISPTDTITLYQSADSMPVRQVQLLYNQVPANATATSTDVVYHRDLIKSPVTNVLNALTGRLAGIYTEQFSGQPASDGVNLSLHGRSPIVLIDGVVRNFTTLDLEEIESVTVLKDAVSTAMLGVRGANGAIQITTRKGSATKRFISFTAQTGIQQPLKMPQTLNAYDYARLRNGAIDNDLRVRPDLAVSLNRLRYSDSTIQGYKAGTDPYRFPDINWQDRLLEKSSTFNRYSLNAQGGNKFSKFFVALEHFNQQGMLKTDPANKYSTNNWIKGYLARTNIDINITPKLSGGIALLGRIINGNEPGPGTGTIFSSILATPNNAYPVYNRDSTYGANGDYTLPALNVANQTIASNLQGLATGAGYLQSYRRDILADFNLKRTLNELLNGLWIKGRVAYSSNLQESFTRTKNYLAYRQNGQIMVPVGLKTDQINTNGITSQGRSSYVEISTGYAHTFKQTHGLDVLLMVNRDNFVNGSDLPYTISGTSGRISYNYQQKYILEGAYAYNGSNRYPGGTKYGFFPSIGAAWNITSEDFTKELSWLSYLKLFASYGKTGGDNPGYYSYIQRYPAGGSPIFGISATGQASLTQGTLAYNDITWEKANKANIGLQGTILKNRLGFTVEYYNNRFYDLLIQRGRNTSILGTGYPNENIGINRYKGMDFQLSWQQTTDNLQYYIAANASIQNSEVLYQDEIDQPYPYLRRTGDRVGRPFGYVADGIFQSDAEVAASATFKNNIPTQPGDIKYRDLNNDGEINQFDITAIGSDKPLTTFGINLGFNYKFFDVSALVQGVVNRNIFTNGNRFFEFQNGGLGQAYEQHLDSWTPTNTDASYPRLSVGNNSNNKEFSSYWVRSGDYLRLKNVEIGFSLPAALLKKAKLQTMRIFVNGLNLLTATKEKDIDPEVYNGGYPIQRLYNFGINIKF
ncbi:MAG: SusC/RagA family TonB-linked outer membrane protein [Ferruginibacter sp.]|nr:SusC/RagA family TonB-linked outer membrane protein [Ferruginibacter sp.]